MKLKKIVIKSFKRFSDLTIDGLPETARLVVLVGPNGCGKSSLFEALATWQRLNSFGMGPDNAYYPKMGEPIRSSNEWVSLDFHSPLPESPEDRARLVYVRTAYRNEADFSATGSFQLKFDNNNRIARLIDTDSAVSDNYRRLVADSIQHLYSGEADQLSVPALRDRLVGKIRESMSRLFQALLLSGTGNPISEGAFVFDKGRSRGFHYKNLSGGEKAAFDLILDLAVKSDLFTDSVFLIDEPEAHMNPRLQANLLDELLSFCPRNNQLWIATHSIGMVRRALQLQNASPNEVLFLDFSACDFDSPTTLHPVRPDRDFWRGCFRMALDDMSSLVCPSHIVLCEGSSPPDFDARCLRVIFRQTYPDTDFVSVGNHHDIKNDRLNVLHVLTTLHDGLKVSKLVDHDDHSEQEIEDFRRAGLRILSRRTLESFLLDDEVLKALCLKVDQQDKFQVVKAALADSFTISTKQGHPSDDFKSASGYFYASAKKILGLTGCGNDARSFMRDILAPLISPDMTIYKELERDIFG